jgi:Zn-dependent peptidase ImmA (M78 family)/DNA-binding XRE family transcriptional regulator
MATGFNPSRLTLVRRRRGVSMTQLAKRIGVEMRSVSAYEKSEFEPERENLEKIAKELRFPIDFFFGEDLPEPTVGAASFRALRRMTAALRYQALGAGAIAFLLNLWLEERFELPQANVPDLSEAGGPEAAANALRQLWGMGELPIKNTVHLLEHKGIRVYSLAIDTLDVDAFSMWHQGTPFIFLNTNKSSEHSRFDAAHELGHLVLHRHGAPQGQYAEREANAFASAFLMPRGSVFSQAPQFAMVDHLIQLKKYWTVSVAALAYRLHYLGILTEWHYRSLYIEMSRRGYRTNEPETAPREVSQLLAKVFSALRAEGVGKDDIAKDLNVPSDEIDELVFGLALTAVKGGDLTPIARKQKPALRLVSSSDKLD